MEYAYIRKQALNGKDRLPYTELNQKAFKY